LREQWQQSHVQLQLVPPQQISGTALEGCSPFQRMLLWPMGKKSQRQKDSKFVHLLVKGTLIKAYIPAQTHLEKFLAISPVAISI